MKNSRSAVALALVLISLPGAYAAVEARSYRDRFSTNGTITSLGLTRAHVLHVPPSYDGTTAMPLVISMHGAGNWPALQAEVTGWNAKADREGFIVVYPSGTGSGRPKAWDVNTGPGLHRDVQYISDLIDSLRSRYNIDGTRIYANGLSNGGGMTFVLSCTLSHRIAAFGMVAAAQTLAWSRCTKRSPAPMITFHGTDDPVVPYEGGVPWIAKHPFPKITTWTANWARRNGCAPDPVDSVVAPDVTRRTYTGCTAPVVLYTIRGGGHVWPGGGPLPEWLVGAPINSINANDVMWEFFQQQTPSGPTIQQ